MAPVSACIALVGTLGTSILPLPTSSGGCCCLLRSLLVLPVHRKVLTRQNVGQGTLVAEFAVALDEPGAYVLLPAGFECLMGERAGRASGTRPNFEEFAWDMGEVFNFVKMFRHILSIYLRLTAGEECRQRTLGWLS